MIMHKLNMHARKVLLKVHAYPTLESTHMYLDIVCEHIGVILSIKRYFAWRISILKGKNWTCAPNYEMLWSLQCKRHTNSKHVKLHILQILKIGNEKMGKVHMNAQRWQCELVTFILENKKDICVIKVKFVIEL